MRGRVTYKSAVRTYDFDRRKLFYFDIMDESNTVRVKAFDHQCDRIITSVCVGEVKQFFTKTFSSFWFILFPYR